METAAEDPRASLHRLVDEYRSRCLWFVPEDFYPRTPEQVLRALDNIERHGDLRAFREARRLKQWLSPSSSAPFAA